MRARSARGTAADRADRPVAAVAMLVISTLFFASQDALTKHLVQTLAVPQIVAVRFFFFALFALIYAQRQIERKNRGGGGIDEKTGDGDRNEISDRGNEKTRARGKIANTLLRLKSAFATRQPGLQILRSLLIGGEIMVFAYAIRFLGLAEMHAIMACFPLIATALSVPLLRESVGWRRWLAVCFGFIGTLIILRPGSAVFQPIMAVALTSALMFALYNVLTRKAAAQDSAETSLLYVGVVGFAGAALLAPFYWQPVGATEAAWLLVISATSIIGHLLLIKALALAPAVILQPFHYFTLVWAALIAFLVYGEVLSPATLLGAAIVVGSGVFIARREYQLMRRARADNWWLRL
ncbi:MAG: DMT family transporter [Gammaproteobacteria bacterium]|nr:DMT family transporter [Gammaproteobacteria bacterium]